MNPRETTDFRSLTCGISWMGMTSAVCQAASSLYQSMLPSPTIEQARKLNAFVEQLREEYVPLTFFGWFFSARPANVPLKLLQFTDSSFANRAGQYPQVCALLYLAWDLGEKLNETRSPKSKSAQCPNLRHHRFASKNIMEFKKISGPRIKPLNFDPP